MVTRARRGKPPVKKAPQPRNGTGSSTTPHWKIMGISAITAVTLTLAAPRPAHAVFDAAAIVPVLVGMQSAIMGFLETSLMGVLQTMLPQFMKDQNRQMGGLISGIFVTNPERTKEIIRYGNTSSRYPTVNAEMSNRYTPIPGNGMNIEEASKKSSPNELLLLLDQRRTQAEFEAIASAKERAKKQDITPDKWPDKRNPPDPGMPPTDRMMANTAVSQSYAGNSAHVSTTAAGVKALNASQMALQSETLLLQIFKASRIITDLKAKKIDYDFNNPQHLVDLSKFLTPPPPTPAGTEPDYEKDALNKTRAGILADVIMGADSRPLLPVEAMSNINAKTLQIKIMTRFARTQLARTAVYATLSPELQKARNEEYIEFVMKPTLAGGVYSDAVTQRGALIRLTQGTNLFLMRNRELQMEQNRLLAVLLTATMEAGDRGAGAMGGK